MIGTASYLQGALADAGLDWLVVGSAANVAYGTEYRSVAGDLFGAHRMIALVSAERTVLVGGASDGAPAIDAGLPPSDYVPFGTFYFESASGAAEASLAGRHADLSEAFAAALELAGVAGAVGFDTGAADLMAPAGVGQATDVTDWLYALRAVKLPAEIDLLRRAARATEQAIHDAVDVARSGVTERELEVTVNASLAAAGVAPRFAVVTAGERSALADARATDRSLRPGDLVRFDVGGTLDGYWSDIGRTAVVGDPSPLQRSRYDAIFDGEQAQIERAGPGISATELFAIAMETVAAAGFGPYRRHHCGHAIGTEVYERPVVAPGWDDELQPGMVFCVETPYYEIGWGGMMVEDAFAVTADGIDLFTGTDRTLRVIEP